MKVVIATILILIVFFVGSIYITQYINASTEMLTHHIEKLDRALEQEDWPSADDYLTALKRDWEKTKKRWQIFLEHYEIDAIDIAVAKVDRYVRIQENVFSLGELAHLRLLIDHVASKEALRLGNLL